MKARPLARRGSFVGGGAVVLAGIAAAGLLVLNAEKDPAPVTRSIESAAKLSSVRIPPHASTVGSVPAPSALQTTGAGVAEAAPQRQHVFSIPETPVPIQFHDGEYVSVQFRRIPPLRRLDLSAVSSRPTFEALAKEGDTADHAFTQYQISASCLAFLQGTQIPGASAFCVGSAEYYVAERDRSLRRAAEAGHVHAVRLYTEANSDFAAALDLFGMAWQVGYIPPLGRIADLYFAAAIAGKDSRQNNRMGLAYLWLQAHLQDVAAGGGRRIYVAELFEKLRRKQEQMDPSDVDAAVQLAKEVLRNNPHCCFGP